MSTFRILFILTFAFIAFAVETDVYVPSFPDMVEALEVRESEIQKILSVNFLGICLSCLLSGPLSDSFGRKRVLSVGTGIFALASLICYQSNQFEMILFGRFIQGLGAGTILAVACTCVFDLFNPTQSGQLVAVLNGAVTIMMAIAPLVGVWLNAQFGWRSCFLLIFVLATLSWLGIVFLLPETLPPHKRVPFRIKCILSEYVYLFRSKTFMLGSFAWTLMFCVPIVYTANVSLLFIGHLKTSDSLFGFYQTITMGSFALSSLACSYLIGKLGSDSVRWWGTTIFFVGVVGLIGVNILAADSPFLISLAMAVVSAGTALAMVVYFTDSMVGILNAGAALSLVQGLRQLLSSQFTDLSRVMFDGSLGSLSVVLVGIAVIVLVCITNLSRTTRPLASEEIRAVL